MTSLATRMSAEDFLLTDHGGFELVDGEPVENAMSDLTSYLGGELFGRLRDFVLRSRLGRVYPQETGIRVWDDAPMRVRKPDVMFIAAARLKPPGDGWVTVAPDLAVEIVSPNDLAVSIERKIGEYSAAGIPLIWVIYPDTGNTYVYRRGQPVVVVDASQPLDGADILPGFTVRLQDLLDSARVDD